jgi:hypothetical protein
MRKVVNMNKLILSAVTAAFLGGLSLTASAVNAAPAGPAPIMSQGDNGIVQVQLSHRERKMIRHERRREMHRDMHHDRHVMRRMRHHHM